MNLSGYSGSPSIELVAFFDRAVDGLAALDVEALEALAESLTTSSSQITLPRTTAERELAVSRRWIFAHLLGETAGRLAMLRRVAAPGGRSQFGPYGEGESLKTISTPVSPSSAS